MVLDKWKKARAAYSKHGLYGLASKLSQSFPSRRLYFSGNVLLRASSLRLPSILDRISKSYEPIRISAADVDEAAACAADEDHASLSALFRRYLADGVAGIALRHGGDLVACNWIFERSYELMFGNGSKISLRIPAHDVFFGNGYIKPSFRMRGLFPLLVRESANALGKDRRCWSSADLWNEVSLASHARLGFAKVTTVTCVTVLGSTWFGYSDDESRWNSLRGGTMDLAPSAST